MSAVWEQKGQVLPPRAAAVGFSVIPALAQALAEGEPGGFSHFALLWCDLPGAVLTCLLSHMKPESCWGCQAAASG